MSPTELSPLSVLDSSLTFPDFHQDWTLTNSVSFTGIGVHTGQAVRLSLHPSEKPGFWLRDGNQHQLISADMVRDTRFSTTVGSVMTIEHALAALNGLGLSAALIEPEGPEAPILDGSSAPWVEAILAGGITALNSPRQIYTLKSPWHWQQGEISISAEPADQLEIDYSIDFEREHYRLEQQRQFNWSPQGFAEEIAAARSFAFERDAAALQAAGLAKGGSLATSLVLIETGGSLNPARWPDEPVRHKILDCLGDMVLLGGWLNARLSIRRGGHTAHVTMVKTLQDQALLAPVSGMRLAK